MSDATATTASVAPPSSAAAFGRVPRRTLKRTAVVSGPGLFTGRQAELRLTPAAAGSGVTFTRLDAAGHPAGRVAALVENVDRQPRHTVLRGDGVRVETVEHLLAALAGAGVTDVDVAFRPAEAASHNGDAHHEGASEASIELPMGDGSSRLFLDAVVEAGVVSLDVEGEGREPLVITKPVQVGGEDGASLIALPGPTDALEVVYTFEAPAPVGRQTFAGRFEWRSPGTAERPGDATFNAELASARTFIFEREAQALRDRGWGGHLTHRDLLVIGADGPIDNAFRYPDEPVRHKVLDLIGDLALAGRPVCGRIIAHKSGHALNHDLVRALLEAEAPAEPAGGMDGDDVPAGRPDPEAAGYRRLLNRPSTDAAIDVRAIQRILPHRFPMLLVDRVLEVEGDRKAIGLKNVTMGDVFFLGHYPRQPIFPGVLIVEAMGQLGGILLSRKLEHTGKIAILLSMNRVKLRQPVTPGDQLILVAEAVRVKSRTGQVRCRAFVADRLAAEAEIKFMLADAEAD